VTGGHRSVVCASAEEAIELVEAGQIGYDVLLTDVVLDGPGGLDGHDVVAAVCRRRPDAGIVMMSGRLEAEVLARIPDGCRPRFVAKPYTKETLLGTVRDAWADARPSGRSRG
jgi:DNA-binding NtrC family response regulator